MMVTKCDLCKKEIDYDDTISARFGLRSKADLCSECGKPIARFLKKNNFIKEEKLKNKTI